MAVWSKEVIGEQFGSVVDRGERLASLEKQGTILESPNNVESLLLCSNDEMMQNTLFPE